MACKYKHKVWDNGWCNVACMYCTLTQESDCEHNHQTNGDRIRAMSDGELATWLCKQLDCYGDKCPGVAACNPEHNGLMVWLQQPANEQ